MTERCMAIHRIRETSAFTPGKPAKKYQPENQPGEYFPRAMPKRKAALAKKKRAK